MRRLRLGPLLKDTFDRFSDYGDLLAAGMSFYALLSMAPLVVMAVTLAGFVFGREHAHQAVLSLLNRVGSPEMRESVLKLMHAAGQDSGKVAAVLALLMLLWAASRLFIQVEEALNLLWGVRETPAKTTRLAIRRIARKRLISFAMVLGCGALLLVTIVLQTMTVALGEFMARIFGVGVFASTLALAQQTLLSVALGTVLFALVYRVLPDVRLHWADVWVGALLTSTMMVAGTWLLGLYLSHVAPAWLTAAIGSIAVFMIWTYYQAQVFLLGAAFTRAWSRQSGHEPEPEFETPAAASSSYAAGSGRV